MVRIKDLIEQLQQYDENLEVGVYIDTTSYGSYYLYEDGATMFVDYLDCDEPRPEPRVFILPCGVEMDH